MKYTTDDGQTFASRAEAKKHEAGLKAKTKQQETTQGLVNWLTAQLPQFDPDDINEFVAKVQADPRTFREMVAPLLRGARKPRSDIGVPRAKRSGKQPSAAAAA